MTDFPRLIEHAFPLKQASLDSVHEKNVRHGHISTLHIWPARRPLAACRAALIATLLPDPGTADGRRELCEKIAGKVVKNIERKKMPDGQSVVRMKEETEGGILHWGRETENAETLEWFRREIRKAYGGRAPKVLDPFAGGGAIPLEAMRLGCEATAVDINPVAWFILKCTLEYPQKLAGQTRPLPEFILHNDAFMAEFFKKAKGYPAAQVKASLKRLRKRLQIERIATAGEQGVFGFAGEEDELDADLAWHVRAWGQWVLDRARRELAQYYPTYADFEPITKDQIAYEHQPMRLVPLKDDGTPDIDSLNAEFTERYLADKRNPRWVAKPTVAYLWARTVTCKNCRAIIPLLRTLWLSKKDRNRVLLTLEPRDDRTGVQFGVQRNVPSQGGNTAQKREHDKRIGAGTTTRSGCWCPCCGKASTTAMTKEDIQLEGKAGRLSEQMFAAVYEEPIGKGYRPITADDLNAAASASNRLREVFEEEKLGALLEPIDSRRPSPNSRGLAGLTKYGISTFSGVFNDRQQLAIMTFIRTIRTLPANGNSGNDMWHDAIGDFLALLTSKLTDYTSRACSWNLTTQSIGHTFTRYAIPMNSDYAESNVVGDNSGGFSGTLDWMCIAIQAISFTGGGATRLTLGSATDSELGKFDVVLTDPPYYDSIPYSDVTDYFYIWLRRLLGERYPEPFCQPLVKREQEIIQHAGRLDGDNARAKAIYEEGMRQAFVAAHAMLTDTGRFVIVFAHKDPDAWETLSGALIQSGFIVDGSWPIQTERPARTIALSNAALASSVWLVCKKRPATARPGWDNNVLKEMRTNITEKLRAFWDAGIRGPDFVWAATGPALEAYSKHPVVRKANEPNATMAVGEFLNHVRRMVVDFVVGRVLTGEQGSDSAAADRLDEVTAYYLLHRHDFGLNDAPVGACILYATACGLSDGELDKTWGILSRTSGDSTLADDDDSADDSDDADSELPDDAGSGGSNVKLKAWNQRKGKSMGYEAPSGKPVPLIDRVHRLMHLWKAGDVQKVDEYLDQHALRRSELFKRVVQSLIELSPRSGGGSERSLLESISNHIGAKGAVRDRGPMLFEAPSEDA